jgi:uncharacterized protein
MRPKARNRQQAMFFFASDLHGMTSRYDALASAISQEHPEAVLLGGDLLPAFAASKFVDSVLAGLFAALRQQMGERYPRVLLILGNDDARSHESAIIECEREGLWTYMDRRCEQIGPHRVYGYPFVPPTPFGLKDWERYDVSHYVPPGSISPEEGLRSVPIEPLEARYATIQTDLERLTDHDDLANAVLMMHAPPYQTALDRALLDGMMFDHAPIDVHIGSIAIRRFIEARQPLVTLHGHVHESARLTGKWMDQIGRTIILGAAHDGPELALIRFQPDDPAHATRELL